MDKAIDFLDLQKQALTANSIKALEFTIVNQTHKIVPYKQALFFQGAGAALKITASSDNMTVDEKGPYALWAKKIVRNFLGKDLQSVSLEKESVPDDLSADWDKWCSDHVVMLALHDKDGGWLGVLWLERDEPFKEAEIAVLDEIKISWQIALSLWSADKRQGIFSLWKSLKPQRKFISLGLLVLALFPVRHSVTAPAEIVAHNPMIASAPYDGVLKAVLVSPGDTVTEGQTLAEMEGENLEAQAQAARQDLETARASLSRLSREVLSAPDKKADLNILKAQIQAREIEYEYARTMLERSEIKSPRDGVAIFSDVNEWQGKPVVTGESIMEIAAPGDIDLLVRIPVDNLIPLSQTMTVKFFPNVTPLQSMPGHIKTVGYQASADADGLLTYKVRVSLQEQAGMRIGWKGTAKIKGGWTVLSYTVLRRPLVALRKMGGG